MGRHRQRRKRISTPMEISSNCANMRGEPARQDHLSERRQTLTRQSASSETACQARSFLTVQPLNPERLSLMMGLLFLERTASPAPPSTTTPAIAAHLRREEIPPLSRGTPILSRRVVASQRLSLTTRSATFEPRI